MDLNILSFHNYLIKQSDIDLLFDENSWLTDKIIGFMYE